MFAFTRFEITRTMRNSKFLLFLIAMPPLLFLGLAQGLSTTFKQDGLNGPTLMMVAMACFAGVGSAMYATGPELSAERVTGWLRQIWVTPLPLRSWMGAKLIQAALLVIPGTLAVEIVARATRGVHITPAVGAEIIGIMILGSIPFALMGHIVGQLLDDRAATVGQLFVLMVFCFLGGVFTPFSNLPSVMQSIGKFFPVYHLVALNEGLLNGKAFNPVHVLVLAAWSIGIGIITIALWQRDGAAG